MKFQPSPHRDEIIQATQQGMLPVDVAQRFGVSLKTAQRYEKQVKSEAADGRQVKSATGKTPSSPPPAAATRVSVADLPPEDILNQVRGCLGIAARPKVLEMSTPELLYPAMVISIQEWGWTPMKPEDFIDTLIDHFLRAAGIEVNTYLKTAELEKLVKFARERGYFGKQEEGDHDSSKSATDSEEGRVGAGAAKDT